MMKFQKDPKWKDVFSLGKLKHYKDDIYHNMDLAGCKRYWKDGKLHRDDGPAYEWGDIVKKWYKEGEYHRLDGPAIECANGDKLWFKEGKLHRLDGPAVELGNGYKKWLIEGEYYTEEEFNRKIKMIEFEKDPKWEYALRWGKLKHYKDETYYNVDMEGNKRYWKDGKLHREDGPAYDMKSGHKYWYKEGEYNRLDGPAVELGNGYKQWWIQGVQYTEEQYKIKMIELQKDPKWHLALRFGELKHYNDDIYYNVDKGGNKHYWKDGKLHRDDGPAIEWHDGKKFWYKEDKLHRLDGPAMECPNGHKEWYIEDKKYTEEEYKEKIKIMEIKKDPKWFFALIFGELKHYKDDVYYNVDKNGDKRYWKDGKFHRNDGPAFEWANGYKAWWIEGKNHRLDGPAVEEANGDKEWWIEGIQYTEEEYKIKMMQSKKDPKWQLALSHGELKHYKDDIYYNVDKYLNKHYWKDGSRHRDDGPALEYSYGQKEWWKNGLLHRLDGPAIERENGIKSWYIEGKGYAEKEYNHKIKKMEFEKDPKWEYALSHGHGELKHYKDDVYYNVDKRGDKCYWKGGKYHRDDGPAIECASGHKEWYKEGRWHRLDGPAIEFTNGDKQWFIEGEKYTEEEFYKKTNLLSPIGILAAVIGASILVNIKKPKYQKEKVVILKNQSDCFNK